MKRLTRDHTITNYGTQCPPVFYVKPGETFEVETYDCLANIEEFKQIIATAKPQVANVTGPICIETAKRGGVLKVQIEALKFSSDHGTIVAVPGKGAFSENIPEFRAKVVQIEANTVRFNDKIRVPVVPMLGKIGVAPPGDPIPSSIPGPHGGNMDNKQIGPGAAVYLPIFHDGAYLGIGDMHAAMGDGESILSAVEVEGEATVHCELVEGLSLTHPLVETPTEVMTVGTGRTLDEASRVALHNLAELMAKRMNLDYVEAAMIISIAGDLRVCQIVNPLVSVRVALPKTVFSL